MRLRSYHGRATARERETFLRVEIGGQIMAVAKSRPISFSLFRKFCTHRFGPLSEGKFEGFNVQCMA